jgi:LysM repeat protein
MNILQQEDLVKGLPDQALMQQAQMPTGELPQFLVVSEIQRREKMRKSFSEAVPENSIKDQVLSSGIAAMNPTPDPLMASAMGAQGGQDPMMQQQMQDPMQQQMPMQDPMMQQQMMAAGGGMMPYRMDQGRVVPTMLESVKRSIDSGELDADGMNQFMDAIGNKIRGVTAEDYYQIVDYLRASGHDVSKIPSSRFDRRDSVSMESLQSRYGIPTEAPEPLKPSINQEEMSQIDAQYEAQYGKPIGQAEFPPRVYGSDIPVGKEFEDDIPALSLVEDNRSVADMFAGVQPRGLETMMPQRSGARSMLPGLEMSTEMMTETGLDSMVRDYQNDSMPKITSLLDSSEKIAPTFATTKAPNKNNYLSQFQRAETLLAELDRTRKETDEAGLPRPSVDSNAMREDLAKGVDLAGLRESYPDTEDATLLKYITAKEAGTTKVNERVEERQAAEALDVANEMSNARYEIQKGDTLYGLSRERGTTVDDIMALNPQIEDRDLIYAGDTLNLSGGGITPYKMNAGRKTYSGNPPYREGLNQFGQQSGLGYALSTIADPLAAVGTAAVDALSFKESRKSTFQEMINNILAGNPISSGARKALADYKAEFPEMAKQLTRSVSEDFVLPEFGMSNTAAANNAPPVVEEEMVAGTAPANDTGGAGGAGGAGGNNSNLLGTPKEFKPKSIDFSNLRSLLGESDIDYKKMGVDYKGLLASEEARSKLASEEARRDAGSNALIQLGAGIAAGDLSKGLSKAGEVAMLGKKDARAEDRSLSALKRQIELADRTQESTLGIKSAEEGRKNREKLVGFEIEVQKEAIKTDKSVYDAYIQHQTLLATIEKLPDAEQKRLDKQLTKSSINYRNAMAENLNGMSDLDLDAYVKTAMAGDVNLQLTLSALSDSKRREWARTQIANGAIPGMAGGVGSSDSSNAAGYKLLSN